MTRFPAIPARSVAITIMALSLVLGGCQTLRDWTRPHPPEASRAELVHIESREFFLLPGEQVVGEFYVIRLREGDTLPGVARHFGLGHAEIVQANPEVDPWVPAAGSRVLLPVRHVLPDAPRDGVTLNLANMRLFHFPPEGQGQSVQTFAVGIGREGWETPTGVTHVAEKKVKPTWIPPASILREHEEKGDPLPRVVPPGPDNPLGDYALRLGMPSYLIHGTNKPYGVGMQVSHGCVRLYPEDIERLFGGIEIGVAVRIVDQPYLAGWQSGELYLEAHPPLEGENVHGDALREGLFARLEREAGQRGVTIDWSRVDEVLQRRDGIATPILAGSPGVAELAAAAPVVAHPTHFHGQPQPGTIAPDDWSLAVATFGDERAARRVAAMLTHQGPPIPARALRGEDGYRVIAGPFDDLQAVEEAAERIRRDFEFDASPVAPAEAIVD